MLVGAAAAVVAATAVATLIAADRPTLASLASRERRGSADDPLVGYFRANPSLFEGEATSPATLLDALERARTRVRAEREAEHALGPVTAKTKDKQKKQIEGQASEREAAEAVLTVLDRIRAKVEAVARFQRQRLDFLARRRRIVASTVVIAAAMAGYAVAANPGKEDVGDFTEATVTGIDFRGANLRGADFEGAKLHDVSFAGTEIEDEALAGARMTDVICPDGAPAKGGCDAGR